jgi:hypothetical protein
MRTAGFVSMALVAGFRLPLGHHSYGSCEERCGRCFSEPGAMPTSGPHRLTAGVKEYKDVNRRNEFI